MRRQFTLRAQAQAGPFGIYGPSRAPPAYRRRRRNRGSRDRFGLEPSTTDGESRYAYTDPHGILDAQLRHRVEHWPTALHGDGVVRPAELRAAVVETPGGPHYVKLTGPAATITRWDASFTAWLKTLRWE
jgi:hypothetical protein